MKRQAGITNQVTIIIVIAALAALVGAIAGGIHMVNVHDEAIRSTADKGGYDRGLKETAQRDKSELEAAQAQITKLNDDRTAEQLAHVEAQATAKQDHDKEIENAKAETEKLRSDIRTGRIVMRDPGARARACGAGQQGTGSVAVGGQAPAIAVAAAGGEQTGAGGLSPEASEFLLGEADRANEVRADLKLCWSIARDDRKPRSVAP